jgi:hypothetical protein
VPLLAWQQPTCWLAAYWQKEPVGQQLEGLLLVWVFRTDCYICWDVETYYPFSPIELQL